MVLTRRRRGDTVNPVCMKGEICVTCGSVRVITSSLDSKETQLVHKLLKHETTDISRAQTMQFERRSRRLGWIVAS